MHRRHELAAPLALGSCVLVMAFDSTAITVALPHMARDFRLDALSTSGLVSVYLIASLCPLPLVGWICERVGGRGAMVGLLLLLAAGSLLGAWATNIAVAAIARAICGGCGAMLMPISRFIIVGMVPSDRLVSAFSRVTLPVVIGPVLGPPIAGMIVSHLSWRWVLIANLPIIVIALVCIMRYVPAHTRAPKTSLDVRGAVISSGFLLMLALALSTGVAALPMVWAVGALAAAAGLASAYLWHAARVRRPIVDLGLLRQPHFRSNTIGIFLGRLVTYAGPFLIIMYLQVGLGMSAATAGTIFLFNALGSTIAQLTVSRLSSRLGMRAYLIGTAALAPLLFLVTVLVTASTSAVVIGMLMLAQGFVRSGQLVVGSAIAYKLIPRSEVSQGNIIVGITQQLAGNVGIYIAATSIVLTQTWYPPGVAPAEQMRPAFIAVALISLLSVAFFCKTPRPEPGGVDRMRAA